MTAGEIQAIARKGKVEALKEAAVDWLGCATEYIKKIDQGNAASDASVAKAEEIISDVLAMLDAMRKEE